MPGKAPPLPPLPRRPTHGEDDSRDKLSRKTPPAGVAAQLAPEGTPEAVDYDDITGNHSGDDLRRMRSQRPTELRIAHLEGKADAHEARMVRVEERTIHTGEAVARVEGQLSVLPALVNELQQTNQRLAEREHITFKAQVDVDTAEAKAVITDKLDAKKARRKIFTSVATKVLGVIAGAIAAGIVGAVIHWWATK